MTTADSQRAEDGTSSGRRIRVALVDDYEVVLQGLAGILRPYADEFDIVEMDLHVQVAAPVDIALYDTFAQAQGDSETVAELVANPGVSRVVVYTWNFQEVLTGPRWSTGSAVTCPSRSRPPS